MQQRPTLTVYQYAKCSTCRKALQALQAKGYALELIPIVEAPPSEATLRALIRNSGLPTKNFFNTSGEVYRVLDLKNKLAALTESQQIKLLASDGKLLKRPLVTDGKHVTVGFKAEDYERVWG